MSTAADRLRRVTYWGCVRLPELVEQLVVRSLRNEIVPVDVTDGRRIPRHSLSAPFGPVPAIRRVPAGSPQPVPGRLHAHPLQEPAVTGASYDGEVDSRHHRGRSFAQTLSPQGGPRLGATANACPAAATRLTSTPRGFPANGPSARRRPAVPRQRTLVRPPPPPGTDRRRHQERRAGSRIPSLRLFKRILFGSAAGADCQFFEGVRRPCEGFPAQQLVAVRGRRSEGGGRGPARDAIHEQLPRRSAAVAAMYHYLIQILADYEVVLVIAAASVTEQSTVLKHQIRPGPASGAPTFQEA